MIIALTKKDVITVNQQFSNGNFNNESSLDFALSNFKEDTSWTKQLAYLTRAILIDHVFEEGNKRTTCALILAFAEINSYNLHEKAAISIVTKTVLKNIISIRTIQEMIEDAITKK
jgi:prophage maintenance system killer protein